MLYWNIHTRFGLKIESLINFKIITWRNTIEASTWFNFPLYDRYISRIPQHVLYENILESFADEDKYEEAQNNFPDEFSIVQRKQNGTIFYLGATRHTPLQVVNKKLVFFFFLI